MDAVLSNSELQESIVDGQLAALRRLHATDFRTILLGFVDQVFDSPRTPSPPVAFDFWDQVDAAAELEELRLFRPAIYKALPHPP
jgi:hypothetical protein